MMLMEHGLWCELIDVLNEMEIPLQIAEHHRFPLADRNLCDWFQMRNDIGHDPTISKWDCLFFIHSMRNDKRLIASGACIAADRFAKRAE